MKSYPDKKGRYKQALLLASLNSSWLSPSMAFFKYSPVKLDTNNIYMIDFTVNTEALNWFVTNDGVMGGISTGEMTYNNAVTAFKGIISLENNGGFSSVFRRIPPLPSKLNSFEIDVLGDGFTYQLRAVTFLHGYRLAYKHDFATKAGVRQTIRLPLNAFKASFRGRLIKGAPSLYSEDIEQIGFLLANKKQGPFQLSLFNLNISTD